MRVNKHEQRSKFQFMQAFCLLVVFESTKSKKNCNGRHKKKKNGKERKKFNHPSKNICNERYQISPLVHLEEFMHVLKLPTFQYASKQ